MEPNMFCYQCQETAKGTGCILKGVCGKESHTAQAMDLLLFVVRGVSVVADVLRKADSGLRRSEYLCDGCSVLHYYECKFR